MHSNLFLVNLDLVNIGSVMKNLADFQFVCHFVTIENGLFYMSKIDIKNNSKRPSKWILTYVEDIYYYLYCTTLEQYDIKIHIF